MHAVHRLAYWLIAAALALGAIFLVAVTVRHAAEPVYRLPPIAVVVSVAAGALCLATSGLLALLPQPRLILLAAFGVFLTLLGVLAIFSIGLLLILSATVVFFALARSLPNLRPRTVVTHVAAGAALGLSVLVLIVISSQSPAVECWSNGVSTHSREWWGGSRSSSGSGSATVAPDGSASGVMRVSEESYRYACSGGTLVEFERTS
jgi:hypothetical protein